MRRIAAAAATIASAATFVVLLAPSASAFTAFAPAGSSPNDDASMCFTFSPPMISGGAATASGLVTTEPLPVPTALLSPSSTTARATFQAPTTVVADVKPLVTTTGYTSICVGGAGARAVAGSVTFTLTLHGVDRDYGAVVVCRYSRYAPPDCA